MSEQKVAAPARPLAVVTGASSGLGHAFARRLAKDGYDLVLVARRQNRLEALAAEVKSAHGTTSQVIVTDLSEDKQLDALAEKLRGMPVALLVNNAGFQLPERFAEADWRLWDSLVRVQCLATVRLAHAVLGGMMARRSGALVNVASIAAFLPIPNSVIYSTVKRFLVTFSEGLLQEVHGTGVKVQALCPGWTRTEIVDPATVDTSHITKGWWSEPEDVVDASLRGLKRGKFVVIPGWRNRLMVFGANITVRPLLRWVTRTFRKNQVMMRPSPEGRKN